MGNNAHAKPTLGVDVKGLSLEGALVVLADDIAHGAGLDARSDDRIVLCRKESLNRDVSEGGREESRPAVSHNARYLARQHICFGTHPFLGFWNSSFDSDFGFLRPSHCHSVPVIRRR